MIHQHNEMYGLDFLTIYDETGRLELCLYDLNEIKEQGYKA